MTVLECLRQSSTHRQPQCGQIIEDYRRAFNIDPSTPINVMTVLDSGYVSDISGTSTDATATAPSMLSSVGTLLSKDPITGGAMVDPNQPHTLFSGSQNISDVIPIPIIDSQPNISPEWAKLLANYVAPSTPTKTVSDFEQEALNGNVQRQSGHDMTIIPGHECNVYNWIINNLNSMSDGDARFTLLVGSRLGIDPQMCVDNALQSGQETDGDFGNGGIPWAAIGLGLLFLL